MTGKGALRQTILLVMWRTLVQQGVQIYTYIFTTAGGKDQWILDIELNYYKNKQYNYKRTVSCRTSGSQNWSWYWYRILLNTYMEEHCIYTSSFLSSTCKFRPVKCCRALNHADESMTKTPPTKPRRQNSRRQNLHRQNPRRQYPRRQKPQITEFRQKTHISVHQFLKLSEQTF